MILFSSTRDTACVNRSQRYNHTYFKMHSICLSHPTYGYTGLSHKLQS